MRASTPRAKQLLRPPQGGQKAGAPPCGRPNCRRGADAGPTVEHVERGQVRAGGCDLDAAMDSYKEAIEIADVIIPGHDNITPNLTRRPF